MGRRSAANPPPPDWTIETQVVLRGQKVEPGTELSIKGERGRFVFKNLVTSPKGQWINCFPANTGETGQRSFDPERVRRVHRNRTARRAKCRNDQSAGRRTE